MSMKNLFNKLRNAPKRYVAAIAVGLAIALPVAVSAGFGPNRPTFDWNNPDDRKGSLTGPVFNSFINTPTYGDERNFVRVAEVVAGQSPVQANFSETKTATAGKEYWVRTFVHNNANQSTNNGVGVAKNTRVSVEIASGTANGVDVLADITADNATPSKVWDTATLVNDSKAFSVAYVPGSAKLYNQVNQNGLALSDAIVSNAGTQIGYDAMNGNVPGCFEYSAYVYVKVKISSPDLEINKRVSKVAAPKLTDSSESVTAKRGETISWRIDYKNTGSETARNITIRDQIPTGLTLVPGSITWIDANHQNGETFQDTALSSGGVNVGNYAVNGNGVIRFQTKITAPKEVCEIKNTAFGRADNVPEQSNDAKVVISDCEPDKPETPIYNCDGIQKAFVSGKTYRFTTNATAKNGAVVKQYRYSFTGSGYKVDAISNQVNGQIDNTFPGPGTYTITVTVDFVVDGKTVSDTSDTCKTNLTIPKEDEKCPIVGKENLPKDSPECIETTTTTALPNTGPGDVVGLFAAATIAGALVHKFILGRRYS